MGENKSKAKDKPADTVVISSTDSDSSSSSDSDSSRRKRRKKSPSFGLAEKSVGELKKGPSFGLAEIKAAERKKGFDVPDKKGKSASGLGEVSELEDSWGIISYRRYEDVFFHQSNFSMRSNLKWHLKVGDKVYFEAVLGNQGSRARWKATKVLTEKQHKEEEEKKKGLTNISSSDSEDF